LLTFAYTHTYAVSPRDVLDAYMLLGLWEESLKFGLWKEQPVVTTLNAPRLSACSRQLSKASGQEWRGVMACSPCDTWRGCCWSDGVL